MKSSDLNNHVPTSLHRSLRTRPSQVLYQPPAKRCADKRSSSTTSTSAPISPTSAPISPTSPTSPKSPNTNSESHSKHSRFPKLTDCKREPLCESKPVNEQEPLANSRISPSSKEDLGEASYTRLKSTEDQCLSGRKRGLGLGRGSLLKLQLLYEHRCMKAHKINDKPESQNSQDNKGTAVHVQNLDKPGPQLSADFNHNNNNNNQHRRPYLKISGSDSPSPKFHNAATPKQVQNDLKPFMCENKVSCSNAPICHENILTPPIEIHDKVPHVSEEAVWRMGKDQVKNIAKSLWSGDWEPEAESSNSPGLDLSLPSQRKNPGAQNDYSSIPDHSSSLTVSDGDSKAANESFYSSDQTEGEESANVFESPVSSLSDESYMTVSARVSDAEENTEGRSRSTDGCDQDSFLSESTSWADCLSEDSSADVFSPSAKTSFNDSQEDEDKECLKEEVMTTVESRNKINHHVNYQAGDNQLNWSTTCADNPISKKEYSTPQPRRRITPNSDQCRRPHLSGVGSTNYSSFWSSNSRQKGYLSACPIAANYQSPTSHSSQPLTVNGITFENVSTSCRSTLSPNFPFLKICNKENISKELTRGVSCEEATRTERRSWPTTKSGTHVDTLGSRVNNISFTNQDRWQQSAFQYQQIFGNVESLHWKEEYKKKCSKAGHKFLDTHCHIDMMFNDLDRMYGTFQEYREAHADSFPKEFGGCVAIFCNPLTFNPRGSLFRSLMNEHNVWIAVGCHPKKVKFLNKRTLQHLNECIRMPQVTAVGEIGLDYSGMFHLESELQKEFFQTQIKLALDVSKPIVIHCRDAEDDCFSILKAECPLDWLIHLHCYMLDFKHAKKWLDTFSNLYIGLTPKVTYRTSYDVHDTASKIPLTRLVLESDAPYFIPRMVPPNQLKCSHPGLVFTVAEKVAELQGRDVREVLKACWDNSHRLYRINPGT